MKPIFRFVPPSAPLRGWVREHRIIRFNFSAEMKVPAKPYWPRPATALAFYPRDPERVTVGTNGVARRKPRAVLIGQPTLMTLRQGGSDFSVYQIEFEPGALHRITGLSLDTLRDDWVDAEAVFADDFRRMVDQIEDHDDAATMIAIAESWLLAHVSRVKRVQKPSDRIANLLLANHRLDLGYLADKCGVDTRQLRRQFHSRIGVGPQLFTRLIRFDRLIRNANRQPSATWLDLAVNAGYFDHQHLARDFRDFTAMTPRAFKQLETAAPERQFGLVE
jgi:AraC-like DNA-binding protein